MEIPIKLDDLGVTPIFRNTHIYPPWNRSQLTHEPSLEGIGTRTKVRLEWIQGAEELHLQKGNQEGPWLLIVSGWVPSDPITLSNDDWGV